MISNDLFRNFINNFWSYSRHVDPYRFCQFVDIFSFFFCMLWFLHIPIKLNQEKFNLTIYVANRLILFTQSSYLEKRCSNIHNCIVCEHNILMHLQLISVWKPTINSDDKKFFINWNYQGHVKVSLKKYDPIILLSWFPPIHSGFMWVLSMTFLPLILFYVYQPTHLTS